MADTDTLTTVRAAAATRPALIWGAGRAGVIAARYLRDHQIEPEGFVDSAEPPNSGRHGEGLPVWPPTHLVSLRDQGRRPFVIVASVHAAAIAATAASLGLHAPADLCIFQTPADAFPGVTDPLTPDFYVLLHELRGHALADMPAGARVMLSAGASGRWYFDWVEQRYGRVARHIGAESFLPKPADLPENVEWLPRDVASMPEVRDNSIDLAFSGQNIEHLWPDQVVGFLLETHRVLASGGWLVMDSPNREMTRPINWSHPEHTIEYSVPDVREILDLAGFGDVNIRGIWLCREHGQLLPLSPFAAGPANSMEVLRRSSLARTRPESSFVWWAEARKTHAPQRDRLIRALDRMFALAWPERLDRFVVPGVSRVDADGRWARLNAGERGIIAEGPLFPLRDGHHRMTMRFRGRPGQSPCRLRLELTRGMGDRQQLVMASEAASNAEGQVSVEIALQESMTFGLRLRVFNLGGGDGEVLLHCECATAAPVV